MVQVERGEKKRRKKKSKRGVGREATREGNDDEIREAAAIASGSTLSDYPVEIQRYMASEGYCQATPVQLASWKAILDGKNCRAMSQPGSGKTLSFLLPIAHLLNSAPSSTVRALIFVPTRELADQIFVVCRKLRHLFELKTISACGGASIVHQIEEINKGADIVVATPGRMVELVFDGHVVFDNLKIIVLDEADKMLSGDLGRQMEGLKDYLFASAAPQICAFSATFPEASDRVLQGWLGDDPIALRFVSDAHWVSPNITQIVHVCAEHKKMMKLRKHLSKIDAERTNIRSKILIFANTIKKVRSIFEELKKDRSVAMLHGKRTTVERNEAIDSFRLGTVDTLIATDVAGRGLDIKNLPYVVLYDFPTRLETYIHRIGRTGRLASNGHAYGFFTRNLAPMASSLVDLLGHHKQWIDPNLRTLARSYEEAKEFMQCVREIEDAYPSTIDAVGEEEKSATEIKTEEQQQTDISNSVPPGHTSKGQSVKGGTADREGDCQGCQGCQGEGKSLYMTSPSSSSKTESVLRRSDAVVEGVKVKRQKTNVPCAARKKPI